MGPCRTRGEDGAPCCAQKNAMRRVQAWPGCLERRALKAAAVSLMPAVGEAMGCRQGAQQAEELRAVGRHLADGRRLRSSRAHTRGGSEGGEGANGSRYRLTRQHPAAHHALAGAPPRTLTPSLGLISHNMMISIHRWKLAGRTSHDAAPGTEVPDTWLAPRCRCSLGQI